VITGKFDQIRSRQPYSALYDAFTELVDQILFLRDKASLAQLKRRIGKALGDQGRVLTELLPSLARLIGEDECKDKIAELPQVQARNRFNYLFRSFCRAVATPEHPLILFLDDLQWA